MKKVGIFGGTFDPPHLGHLIMAEEARIKGELDEIWWMPNYVPPHKKVSSKTTEKQRIDLVTLMVNTHDSYKLCLIEMQRKGLSYTADTVQDLLEDYPNMQFSFIMGGDSLKNFHSWHKSEELQAMLPFIVIVRPGFQVPRVSVPKEVLLLEEVTVELSSSYIRKSIRSNKENKFLLLNEVYQFIKENRLYE
ncbi:nicotinate (nicotinamide) nucleotide adenylyltransferase [Salipaludibacillus neizhouensis]|uniref:Probable nicotinate-nucleotide adenylyltransferase n=1 Tax=Salipaludibacillus neizhouensis TaxID=885475 RepID=A0A3A9K6I0_9BACI|nr:nicotinate-nucleotide adenylyltransferase [Salipaludibacillus neizhouensis]RKL68644.1 nicotinate (nicotinamide) nucleotide adenylyltransferase [Salipaludibacillus neizhouensis]